MVVIPADQGQEPGLILAVYSYLKTVQNFNMHNVSPCVLCLSFRLSHSRVNSSLRHGNTHVCKRAKIHDATGPCVLLSSDSINGPLGEDDSCIRLMSRRSKGASPSTSLGSTLTWLPSAPTKPHDSWYRLFTIHPRIPVTAMTLRLPMSQFRIVLSGCRAQRCPKPRPWWHGGLERAQRGSEVSRVWGFVNWWVDLNDDWAKLAFWRLFKPEQIY